MEFVVHTVCGQPIVAGTPDQPLMERAEDVKVAIEACFEHGSRALLLYSTNLPAHFFDLSSGEAGVILQQLRNYDIRFAIVRAPELELRPRFLELLADERRGPYFHMFEDSAAAEQWLGCEESI